MDFEKLRSDPRVAYLLGVGIGVALGLVIAARLRPQPTLWEKAQSLRQPCPECERTKVERAMAAIARDLGQKDRAGMSDDDPGFS